MVFFDVRESKKVRWLFLGVPLSLDESRKGGDAVAHEVVCLPQEE